MLIDRLKNGIMSRLAQVIYPPRLSFVIACCALWLSVASAAGAIMHKPSNVIDGDTLVLQGGTVIRLLGINAPEIAHHGQPAEQGGWRAKQYLKTILAEQSVYLQYDVERKDRYGRTLAQVFLANGVHLNAEMLRHGMATLSIHPPNMQYLDALQAAQSAAEDRQRGVWSLPSHRLQPIATLKQGNSWGRFVGRVSRIRQTKKGSQLYLGDRHYIWIAASAYRYFPALETYSGRLLEVRAWPKKWGKAWSLRVIHSSQIILKPNEGG